MEGAVRSLAFLLCLIIGVISEQDFFFFFFSSPLGHNELHPKKHVVVVASESYMSAHALTREAIGTMK